MDPKQFVVHLEGGERDAAVLKLTESLAARFAAAIDCLFVRPPPYVPVTLDGLVTPQILQIHADNLQTRATRAHYAFNALPSDLRARSRLTEEDGRPIDRLLRRGRNADLTVISQSSPDQSDGSDYDLPADLVMGLGRPVLIVPYAGEFASVGERVLVAWNGSRESARAVADALPLMAGAERVTVLMVTHEQEEEASAAGTAAYLGRHGISAEVKRETPTDIETDDVILSRAADFGADMIVMGAYGRARLREMILGGATHGILRQMTVPVLMSH
jgi:nucleotide-binding universal stress UspA family protein